MNVLRRNPRRRGLSLLEVEVSLLIFMFGTVALMAFPSTLHDSTSFSQTRVEASRIAQTVLEYILAQPFDQTPTTPPPNASTAGLNISNNNQASPTSFTVTSYMFPGLSSTVTYTCYVTMSDPSASEANYQGLLNTTHVFTIRVQYIDPDPKHKNTVQKYEITGYKIKGP
jgi:Tfp pilus assembly protein PilV